MSEEANGDGAVIKVTVKTLDSQNHEFLVDENMLVKDFKNVISEKVRICVEHQRLIFRGRVLQDEKIMKDYNVADNTVHVVQRAANSAPRSNDEPPPPSRTEGGMPTGLFISAQRGPVIPHFGRNPSAASRLQVSNRMLSRAVAVLRRLEEHDSINLDVSNQEGRQAGDDIIQMDVDVEEGVLESVEIGGTGVGVGGNTFGGVINQVANAAALAALAGTRGPGQGTPNALNLPTNVARRRNPESPRLVEMATVVQGILTFQDRLAPYLMFLENVLRMNYHYADLEQRDSMQFLFDNISSIFHFLSHSYHALSDMICNFSVPPETRRLRAATAIVLESSTVLRGSIPIAVPIPAQPSNAPVADNGQGNEAPQLADISGPQNTTPPVGSVNDAANRTEALRQNFASGINQQLSQLLGGQGQFGGMGGNMPSFGVQIQIEGPMRGGGSGHAMNIQDFAQAFGIGELVQNNPTDTSANASQPAGQQQSQTSNLATPGHGGHSNGGQNSNPPNPTGMNSSSYLQVGSPFDNLLVCNSHHHNTRVSARPANFRQYVDIDATPPMNVVSQDFFTSLFETGLQSNLLPLLQPMFQNVIQNYIMRGRDPRNEDHIRSAAKKLTRIILPFLLNFSTKIPSRNMKYDYAETFSGIINDCLSELMYLTMTMGMGYQSAVMSTVEKMARQICIVFKICFGDASDAITKFCDYLVEVLFGGNSLVFKDTARTTFLGYFSVLMSSSNAGADPVIVELPTVTPPETAVASTSTVLSPSTPNCRPNTSSMSPEVVPPKQAKQSFSPLPTIQSPAPAAVDEDLDEFLNLNVAPRANLDVVTRPLPDFENALRNIPSEWVDTVRHDLTRQLGMPDQPPFSPAYTALFGKKST